MAYSRSRARFRFAPCIFVALVATVLVSGVAQTSDAERAKEGGNEEEFDEGPPEDMEELDEFDGEEFDRDGDEDDDAGDQPPFGGDAPDDGMQLPPIPRERCYRRDDLRK